MSQKLTLARYLEGRGSVKSLTRIEADAFGVPYPLVSGWPARHGAVEITDAMLKDLATRVASAKRSTANKARRGLEGVGADAPTPSRTSRLMPAEATCLVPSSAERASAVRMVQGFILRKARRHRTRTPAPWT